MGVFLKLRKEGKSLTVVGDGSQKRDFVNVKDVVEANILGASASLKKSEIGTVFNIGSGVNFSILEVANMISDNVVHLDSRVGESAETLADISKAETLLNWKPTISLLQWINIQLAK
jgi:UDP-glucose 4-epimerase